MPISIFNDMALRAASFALDGLSLRQRVTANNIANVDTPNYKAQLVSFEDQLQNVLSSETDPGLAVETTHNKHLGYRPVSSNSFISINQRNSELRNDGNNVDIDIEMTALAETSLRYQALTKLAGSKLALLKTIIRDSQ
jgi:flagellar basal-body rod protein FlgB